MVTVIDFEAFLILRSLLRLPAADCQFLHDCIIIIGDILWCAYLQIISFHLFLSVFQVYGQVVFDIFFVYLCFLKLFSIFLFGHFIRCSHL